MDLVFFSIVSTSLDSQNTSSLPSWSPNWTGTLAVLFVTCAFAIFLFRRKRRLTLPPGPACWPVFGNWLQIGDNLGHKRLAEIAQKYGDIFLLQMGQRKIVVVSSSELAKEVLHTQGAEFASRCRNFVYDIFMGKGQDLVFSGYGEQWRKLRRIMTVPLCTSKAVRESIFAWEDEIGMVVDYVTSTRESFTSGIVIRKRLQLMVYNILYRMMFNRRFENEEDPLYVRLEAYNSERSRLAQSFENNYGDFLPILRPFLRGYLKQCKDLQNQRLAFFRDCFLEERKKLLKANGSEGGGKCAIDRILEDHMNDEIDENNALFIIENLNIQAIESTLYSMEWVLAEIVNHSEIQGKVRNELDEVLGEAPISEPDVSKLPYLQAVVKESLRLHMPIPLLMPHMNLNQAKLGKYDIPPGTKVIVNAWWIANKPDLWENPEQFVPERFMKDNIEVFGTDFRYLPFGSGRRCCPGSIIALPLLCLVVGRLLQTYELLPGAELDQVDMTEWGGQSGLHLLNHSLIRVRVRA